MNDELIEKVLVETVGKFDIYFTPLIEYENPLDNQDCESEEQKQEYQRKLENGDIAVFCARITAEMKGVELGSQYLGMCEIGDDSYHYDYKDFYLNPNGSIKIDDYYSDMKTEAITEAKQTLKSLTRN